MAAPIALALALATTDAAALEVTEQGIIFESDRADWIRQTAPPLLTARRRLFFHFGPVADSGLRVIIAADRDRFEAALGAGFPDWGVAAALPDERRIVLQAPGTRHYAEPYAQVVGHEYAHVYLHLLAGGRAHMPRWLDEGFAMHAGFEWDLGRYFTLGRAAVFGGLVPLADLEYLNSFRTDRAALAYTEAFAAYAFLEEQYGREAVGALIAALGRGAGPEAAFRRALGSGYRDFALAFEQDLHRRYNLLALFTDMGFIWALLALLIVVGWWLKRRRAREIERRWRIEDRIHGEADFDAWVDPDDDESWRR